jgi:trans-aconitate methyltransferase
VPVLGVYPARNVAEAARAQGVPTVAEFFGVALAESLLATNGPADLIVANNVYAHVPDLHDLTGGFAVLLAPGGTLSIEFPHLVRLVEGNQFDTIYHEHFRVGGMAGTDRQRRSLPGPGPIARQATSLARNAVHRDNA